MRVHWLEPGAKFKCAQVDDRTIKFRHAAERTNDVWIWNVTVLNPGPAYGSARDLETAKAAFREAWAAFKTSAGPELLARAIETQNNARNKGKTFVVRR